MGRTCETVAQEQPGLRLIAGETATAGDIVEWQERRHAPAGPQVDGQSDFRSYAPDDRLTVCVFEGEFATPVPPGAPAADTGIFIVDSTGTVLFDSAGPGSSIEFVLPSQLLASAESSTTEGPANAVPTSDAPMYANPVDDIVSIENVSDDGRIIEVVLDLDTCLVFELGDITETDGAVVIHLDVGSHDSIPPCADLMLPVEALLDAPLGSRAIRVSFDEMN